jgi:hypothetical protein
MQARRWILSLVLGTVGLVGPAATALADAPPEDLPPAADALAWAVTPSRVSYLSGGVSFWRPAADGWAPAQLNIPLAPGDALRLGPDGTAEIQVGPRAFVRAAPGTELALERQEPGHLALRVDAGQVGVDLSESLPGQALALVTPNAVLTLRGPGYYRVGVDAESTGTIAYRGAPALVAPPGGAAVTVAAGQQLVVSGVDAPALAVAAAPALSGWDRWGLERSDALGVSVSARFLPPEVYGAEALDRHGEWQLVEPYGPVWIPAGVPADWAPYSTGRWLWDPRYGWTWLDDAPWGWAPFHYGRWVVTPAGRWAWAPGLVSGAVYAPALVAFLGPPPAAEPAVCWVALGWDEPAIPWWGGAGFAGRPWWGGARRGAAHVVLDRRSGRDPGHPSGYRNAGVRHAVVAVPPQRFARDRVADVRIRAVDPGRVRPAPERVPPGPARAVTDDLRRDPPGRSREPEPGRAVARPRPGAPAAERREVPVTVRPAAPDPGQRPSSGSTLRAPARSAGQQPGPSPAATPPRATRADTVDTRRGGVPAPAPAPAARLVPVPAWAGGRATVTPPRVLTERPDPAPRAVAVPATPGRPDRQPAVAAPRGSAAPLGGPARVSGAPERVPADARSRNESPARGDAASRRRPDAMDDDAQGGGRVAPTVARPERGPAPAPALRAPASGEARERRDPAPRAGTRRGAGAGGAAVGDRSG